MKYLRRAGAALMFILILGTLYFAPPYLRAALRRNAYTEMLTEEREDYTGIIVVWHVAEFKPYRGGLATLLKAWGKALEQQYYGIFYKVLAMTPEEAGARIARGETPDILSFPAGYSDGEELSRLEIETPAMRGNLLASGQGKGIPYAMSGYCLLLRTEFLQERSLKAPKELEEGALAGMQEELTYVRRKKEISGLSGDAVMAYLLGARSPVAATEAFAGGTAAMCVTDLRGAGDFARLSERGRGFNHLVLPLGDYTPLVQYIGLHRDMEAAKRSYAELFLKLALTDTAQASLLTAGLLPVTAHELDLTELEIVSPVRALFERLAIPQAPAAFLYQRYRQKLYEGAARALAGESETYFVERFKELVPGIEIQ